MISKCPACDASLEGSIKVYLSDVVLSDGRVKSFTVSHLQVDSEAATTQPLNDAIDNIVHFAEGNELLIYCQNDHQVSLNGEVE